MGKMSELDLKRRELEALSEPKESEQVINRNGEEIKFFMSDLSNDAKISYVRANQIAQEIQQLEMNVTEKKFITNNYINSVLNEIEGDNKETKDESDTK